MNPSEDPYIIIIRSGPVWDIEDHLAHFAEAFGSHYEGEILTWANSPAQLERGRFLVSRVAIEYGQPLSARIRYTMRLVYRAIRARCLRRRRLVVIAYDPFQSGVVALLIKWLTGAKFVCEVNGVYGHPKALIDLQDPAKERQKRNRMLRFGSFVLRRSDAIKLLYPEQLVGFSVPEAKPPRFSFHDLVNGRRFEPTGGDPENVVLLVGHPYLLKGGDLLIDAFARLADDFPDWRLELVGWRLEEAAGDVPLGRNRISFPGPQPQRELARTIERAAIFALPSRSEGMGRVLLEAAFMGRPRIASRVGGIPYVVEDGVDGLLIDSGDVDDLERALRILMSDEKLRRSMGAAARRRALEEFSACRYIDNYKEVIGHVVA